jgi:hypothetical protein
MTLCKKFLNTDPTPSSMPSDPRLLLVRSRPNRHWVPKHQNYFTESVQCRGEKIRWESPHSFAPVWLSFNPIQSAARGHTTRISASNKFMYSGQLRTIRTNNNRFEVVITHPLAYNGQLARAISFQDLIDLSQQV